jgi:dolichyl-phosphate-mannose-protein mannosyltransferase
LGSGKGMTIQAGLLSGGTASNGRFSRAFRPRILSSLRPASLSRRQLITSCVVIFLIAFGVRLLHWDDTRAEINRADTELVKLGRQYRLEAQRMREEGGFLFPREHDPADARMLLHPPGYPLVVTLLYGNRLKGHTFFELRMIQVLADCMSAILVFLIAIELLPFAAGMVGALLVALSPHISYYTLWFSPDTLSVLPILIAVYLLIRAWKSPRLISVVTAGALVGMSCWIRANALLLPAFLAIAILIVFDGSRRVRYSLALVAAAVAVISPLTIRNWVVFHHLIPVSVDAGMAMVQGIGNADKEGRFGMPVTGREVVEKDVEWSGRAEYSTNLWMPDGIERDRVRMARGLAVARKNPGWFLGTMVSRAGLMLSYNDSAARDWPFDTATVPLVAASPVFNHQLQKSDLLTARYSASMSELMPATATGAECARQADGSLPFRAVERETQNVRVLSHAIQVKPSTDYVFALSGVSRDRVLTVNILSENLRRILGSTSSPSAPKLEGKLDSDTDESKEIYLPFASGDSTSVRIELATASASSCCSVLQAGHLYEIELGPTPLMWTRIPRSVIRLVQQSLFRTPVMVPLVCTGIVLLVFGRRRQALALLLVVPAYYLIVHSPIHTEYRYTLGIHYFLFICTGVTAYCLWSATEKTVKALIRKTARS